jgi:2-iminobutanoate/2-iminopropanoate deaminase
MSKKRIETDKAPAAIGPYSQAVVAERMVFCSGQVPLDPEDGRLVGDGDPVAETEQVLRNLDAVLEAAGCQRSDVLKATVYLLDMNDFSKVNEVYAAYFEGLTPPARACVQVAALPKGAKVEIEFLALRSR